ncbi:MAG: aminopeptidase P family protein [Anaerolineae bacterium]|nr:aminopeptidase P family protein [Anaerolineae bacterium]
MTSIVNEELARARSAARSSGCDAVLLSSIANITYISGFEVPFPLGAGAEMGYGPTLALFGVRDHSSWLIPSRSNAGAAEKQSRLDHMVVFETFDTWAAIDSHASFLDSVRQALKQAGLANTSATLGIEVRYMPFAVASLLAKEFPKLSLVDVETAMQQARLIKTEREIGLLRRASAIGDVGHRTLAELCQRAGLTEFEMWAEITSRMFRAVGHDVPVVGELVTGPRTTTVNYPDGPREYTTKAGDAALMDISQRIDGYWSDCTNTHVIAAKATERQRKYAKASQAACEAAMDSLRPGKMASDASKAAEAAFQKFGLPMAHYTGHQLGVTVNELPRLVHYDHTPIEAGMVFAVEPGAYEGVGGTFGARSEKIVLVTPTGPEILSQFEWGIE